MPRGIETTFEQKRAIVSWLEKPENFNLVNGKATDGLKMVVAGKKLKKTSGHAELADHVHAACGGVRWDGKTAGARLKSMVKIYKETKRLYLNPNGPKFGLSENDLARGLNTIESKLNDMCPFYAKLDALYGERANVLPKFTLEPLGGAAAGTTSLEPLDASSSDDDSDDDDDDYDEEEGDDAEKMENQKVYHISDDDEEYVEDDDDFDGFNSNNSSSSSSYYNYYYYYCSTTTSCSAEKEEKKKQH